MKTADLVQGTPEWHEFRAAHHPASEAAKAMGISPYGSVDEYLYERKTGRRKPFPEFVANKGHETEAAFRPIAEELLDAVLLPVTGVSEEHPKLSASFDGLDKDKQIIWEHKQFSLKLDTIMSEGSIPDWYMAQVQQQLLVSGADVCHFTMSDGTRDKYRIIEIKPDLQWQKKILLGWERFEDRLKTFDPLSNVPNWDKHKPEEKDLSGHDSFLALEQELAERMDAQRQHADRIDEIKIKMLEMAGGMSAFGNKFKIIQSERKGAISWSKAVKSLGLDESKFEEFRGKTTTTTTFKRIEQ